MPDYPGAIRTRGSAPLLDLKVSPSMKRVIVAIDGPAGAGKSTIARRIAEKTGFVYIDTGAMYRAVALWALRADVDLTDMHKLEELAKAARLVFLDGGAGMELNGENVSADIRTPEVAAAASKVAAVTAVRRALVEKQREIAANASVVMEGRDIGTVVFPEAAVKVYLDADQDVRARRRAHDLIEADTAKIAREIADRDKRDASRPDSPMMQAPDAVYLDSSGLNLDQVEEAILKLIRDRTSNGKEIH